MNWFKHKKGHGKQVIFSLDESLLVLAVMKGKQLLVFDKMLLEAVNSDTIATAVASLVDKHFLVGTHVSFVLPDTHYQLLMTDQLAVPENEMTKALRWKMKGLLDMPVNDAALDTFLVPAHGMGNKRKKVFVVAADKTFLSQCSAAFNKALVPLSRIDIALFSLRNLLAFETKEKRTQLLISLSETQCVLTIVHNNDVYLVRKPNIGIVSVENCQDEAIFEQLLLEIQRSTDYCLSELKLPAPSDIVFSPTFLLQGSLVAYIKQHLTQKVHCLDLNELVTSKQIISLQHQKSLYLSVGLGMIASIQHMVKKEAENAAS